MSLDRAVAHRIATEVVEHLRMPPQFHIRLAPFYDNEDIVMTIDSVFPDVYDVSKTTTTYMTTHLWWTLSELSEDKARFVVITEITRIVRVLWSHELDEWLTVDGGHVKEPHLPGHPCVIVDLLSPEAQAQMRATSTA